jgi:alanine-glyoxylate transaminase / serine-glyoxylate transaminase / serine-pyruvate transaminase
MLLMTRYDSNQAGTYRSGRHFLQIPGPTNVPDRVLRAMAAPTIDHRGPEFAALARQVLADVRQLCGTARPVALYPSSGTGAWEAALVNTLSPGSQIPPIRAAIDSAGHPALLIVDTVSSLGCVDYRHDEWGVDVTVWCSQKGMMLPPGPGLPDGHGLSPAG